jgi:hypothetical protein
MHRFELRRDVEMEATINKKFGELIHSGHTKVTRSTYMASKGFSVLKTMKPRGELDSKTVEYHFLQRNGEYADVDLDDVSMSHAVQIIRDCTIVQLNLHRVIKIHCGSSEQHKVIESIAKSIADETGKSIRGAGSFVWVIEEPGSFPRKPPPFYDFIKKLRESHKPCQQT